MWQASVSFAHGHEGCSLPDSLRAVVEERATSRGCGTTGEYIREPTCRDRVMQRLRGLILEGLASPPKGLADDAFFDGLRRGTPG